MPNNILFSLLCCPTCKKNLKQIIKKFARVNCNKEYLIINNIPDFSGFTDDKDIKLSQKKWDEIYKRDAKTNFIKFVYEAEKRK